MEDLKVFKILEDFQSKFWRGILSLPKSCPLPALTYESNSMLMQYRVYNKIMNFAKHIFSQNDDTLCKQVMNEQIKNNWSGLSSKASKICEELNVAGLYDSNIRKKEFKVNAKKACAQMNENQLKEQISSYKKMVALRDEISKGNGYFFSENLQSARTIFRFRVELFEAKMNFKNKPEFKKRKLPV